MSSLPQTPLSALASRPDVDPRTNEPDLVPDQPGVPPGCRLDPAPPADSVAPPHLPSLAPQPVAECSAGDPETAPALPLSPPHGGSTLEFLRDHQARFAGRSPAPSSADNAPPGSVIPGSVIPGSVFPDSLSSEVGPNASSAEAPALPALTADADLSPAASQPVSPAAAGGLDQADLLADTLHRFDQQQRLFRLQVEQQESAFAERAHALELREQSLRERESRLARERALPPQHPATPTAPVSAPAVVPPTVVPPAVNVVRPGATAHVASAATGVPASPPLASDPASISRLRRDREELQREKLLFEGRIRFQQEHLQRTLRDLESRQIEFRREQQLIQTRLTEREQQLARRERQLQVALAQGNARRDNSAGSPPPSTPPTTSAATSAATPTLDAGERGTGALPPSTSAGADGSLTARLAAEATLAECAAAQAALQRDRQEWAAERQRQLAEIEQQRGELSTVFAELNHRRQQLTELCATVEQTRRQVATLQTQGAAASTGAETPANSTNPGAVSQPPAEPLGGPATPGRETTGRETPTGGSSHPTEGVVGPAADDSSEVIVVYQPGGTADSADATDYSAVYRPQPGAWEQELHELRARLDETGRQWQMEREAWAHERLQWTRWADALEERQARELDQYRQRDELWQQQAHRWQRDRDEARAVITDLLAKIHTPPPAA